MGVLVMPVFRNLNWTSTSSRSSAEPSYSEECFSAAGCSCRWAGNHLHLGRNWSGRSMRRHGRMSRLVVGAQGNGNDESNPLGERGFWDNEAGRKKLDEILQMRELIAEAEKLRIAAEAGELGKEGQARAAKLQEELARRAKEQAEKRKQAEAMFEMGQRAYGRGIYNKAVELLEAASTNVSFGSNLGGEILLWLAMAYVADNRYDECISLYKRLESSHPSRDIRRQAADLRYIQEAPKLKISKEEWVSIPLIDAYGRSSEKTWSQMVREHRRIVNSSKKKSQESNLDEWLVWNPPRWEKSPYFWVALTVWLTLAGISLMFQE